MITYAIIYSLNAVLKYRTSLVRSNKENVRRQAFLTRMEPATPSEPIDNILLIGSQKGNNNILTSPHHKLTASKSKITHNYLG